MSNPNPNRRDPLGLNSPATNITPGRSRAKLPDLPSPPQSPAGGSSVAGSFSLPSALPFPPKQVETTVPDLSAPTNTGSVEAESPGAPPTQEEKEHAQLVSALRADPNPFWDVDEDGLPILTTEEQAEIDELMATPLLADEEWATVEGSALAADPATPLATQFALAQNNDTMVRENLAMTATTPEVLDLLFSDVDEIVQLRVLDNPATSDETFARFASSKSEVIIMNFVAHPRTTREMLLPMLNRQDLNDEEDGFVLRMALEDSDKLTVLDKQRIPAL